MKHFSSYYLNLFEIVDVTLNPASSNKNLKLVDDIKSYPYGYVELGEFGVLMIAENNSISQEIINQTRDILSQVVELDNYVRSRPSEEEHSYELLNIEIRKGIADFYYGSNEVNATWYAYFEKTNSEWEYKGLG